MLSDGSSNTRLVILMPVYNDWEPVGILCAKLDRVLSAQGLSASLVAVDDGSDLPMEDGSVPAGLRALRRIEVLRLSRNLGHQRAICVGLAHLHAQGLAVPVVIMDSDGEDAPEGLPRLLARFSAEEGRKVVFAARARRAEGFLFRLGYLVFRLVHFLLTGRGVRVGNFSVLPPSAVASLVTSPSLWSHYAATVFSTRIPCCSLPIDRSKRLAGASRMNLVALVVHGLSAISVFSEVVGVRLLLACALLGVFATSGIAFVVAVRLFTLMAIPGWATYTVGLLTLALLQSLVLAACFCLLILSGRSAAAFLPCRDYMHFVARSEVAWSSDRETEALA